MLYAQFSQKSAISDDIVEACGDRAVIILDARHSMVHNASIARAECIKRGYKGFTLYRGEAFSRSSICRALELVL